MSHNLKFLAGKKALSIIREEGLNPDRIKVMAGAAGGPKWLVLSGLDRVICSSFFKDRIEPLFLIGSSIGAWRFAAISQTDQLGALERFQYAYINQSYSSKPTPNDVSSETVRIMNAYLSDNSIGEILSHPYMRLNLMAVRCRWLVASDKRVPLGLGLFGAALFNFFSRSLLGLFFERSLFYDPRDVPPFCGMDGFPIQRSPLTFKNMRFSLIASGSIPLVMQGISNIPGALQGVYRDGGVVDYHLDIPFIKDGEGIVLYPHYIDRIIPGWLDKKLPWRKPALENMENVILVCPAKSFTERLPYGKIPDRNDFHLFKGRDRERIEYWNRVVEESKGLGDEFMEAVETGRIRDLVEPM